MSRLRQAAQALIDHWNAGEYQNCTGDMAGYIAELSEALAQPDLAKVGEVGVWGNKRQWVGLTHDEVNSWNLPDSPTVFEFAQFIEAKLKEKNESA